MKVVIISVLTLIVSVLGNGCAAKKDAMADVKQVMEVTTFNIKANVDPIIFAQKDAKVGEDFTQKQNGFLHRQSWVDGEGNYAVIVFWNSVSDAESSMNKFMNDPSVSQYAQMIDDTTMKMSRYNIDQPFDAHGSQFIEVMAYDLKPNVKAKKYAKLNNKVGTDFTSKRDGFVQRMTGTNEKGRQIIAVYWEDQAASDASLEPFMNAPIAKKLMEKMETSSVIMGRYKKLKMKYTNKEKVVALLNSFNTGDQAPIGYINPDKYIQHNLSVGDGLAGFGQVMQHAPPQGFKANVIRAFEDGDYVFTHTEYDFFGPKIGFDVFRFEDGLIVEHWDNLIEIQPKNPSGRTQIDGATDITDKDKTGINKQVVTNFIEDVLLNSKADQITSYINPSKYIQHNPAVADGLEGFGAAMKYFAENNLVMEYEKLHKVMGEGNFVLTISEGKFGKGEKTAFYDLFRLENGLIVEHWDVIAPIPPKSEWKNDNGKF